MRFSKRTIRSALPAAFSAAILSSLLAGCGQSYHASEKVTSVDVKEEAPGDAGGSGEIAVSVPRIAYTYSYEYRLAADQIATVQNRQANLCEKQGVAVCRVIDMKQDTGDGDYASGSMTLAVAAPRARAFGAELAAIVTGAQGKPISSSIAGEDLSKAIVDTTARLKARTVLRDRLMEILATRKGTVAELVEAERGVAKVNEEIDQARNWLAEMNGRVDYSTVNLSYVSQAPSQSGFLSPIREAIGSLDTILGTLIAIFILIAAVGIPIGLAIWAVRLAVVRLRRSQADASPD
ncbi:DUF4349 domain-containing protein [Novosphingobium profundi]|uniref:DUF4349 domain-containing protein n=1 Tax=Novosphingobium profundi TaxID=1774954 RepID=UPI001BD953A2|nr:DUF4349 domain-containing protein [Novosphingobium profundi]MBT0669641.1 DUF4349 domain-containing protein [Novosphingobium profundi]